MNYSGFEWFFIIFEKFFNRLLTNLGFLVLSQLVHATFRESDIILLYDIFKSIFCEELKYVTAI